MSLNIEVITPERIVYSSIAEEDVVQSVTLPGHNGELGILPGHLPLMTTLMSGRLLIQLANGQSIRMAVHGGFAQVLPNGINILTDQAELGSEIDATRAKTALDAAEKRLSEAVSKNRVDEQDALEAHKAALKRARARLFVAEEDK